MTGRIKLLGNLHITEANGSASALMKSGKGCALLAYLVVHNQPQPREKLGDLLWQTTTTQKSLHNLRTLLNRSRPHLPELQATRTHLAFQSDPARPVDLLELLDALQSDDLAVRDAALRLYRGDLLADFHLADTPQFNEWLLVTRERLRRQVLLAHQQLCSDYADQKQWPQVSSIARRWLTLDELDELAHRRLITSLLAQRDTVAARQQYERCRQLLWHELGVEPEPETAVLAQYLPLSASGIIIPTWPPADELAEPGALPTNAFVPFHRNPAFVGRESLLLRLAEQLSNPAGDGAVALCGLAGLGKTQLAVEFAFRYGRFFSGGVFWLSFADPDSIAEEIAYVGSERGMGLYQEADRLTLSDRVGRVQKAWQEPIPRLLIFDNCENEALLTRWLPVTGGCRVLITSRREQWSRGLPVTAVSLTPLSQTNTVRLLQQLVPDLSPTHARTIGEELGHLPLALFLAGIFLRRYPQISPGSYLQQLRNKNLLQHPSLRGHGSRYSPTNHELDVARTFALSFECLLSDDPVDKAALALLARIACFAPGEPIPRPLLEATLDGTEADWENGLLFVDGLGRLLEFGFLQEEAEDGFYVMHRLLVFFVRGVLEGQETLSLAETAVYTTLRRRLHAHLEESVFQATLPVPLTHLRHITEAALTNGSHFAPYFAHALGRHLRQIGEFAEARSYLERGIQLAQAAGNQKMHGRLLITLTRVYESQGQMQKALETVKEAEHWLLPTDTAWLATAFMREGWIYLVSNDAQAALAAAKTAEKYSRASDDQNLLFDSLNLLGAIQYFLLGNFEAADQVFGKALAISRATGNRSNEATVSVNMGEVNSTYGEYARAVIRFQEAIAIVQEIGHRVRELAYTINLSEALNGLEAYDLAVSHLAPLIAEMPADWKYAAYAHVILGESYCGQGNVSQALTVAQKALALSSQGDEIFFYEGRSWRLLGNIAAQTGKPVAVAADDNRLYDAAACFATASAIFADEGNQRERALVLWAWAKDELARGNVDKGDALWQEARQHFVELRLPLFVTRLDGEWEQRPFLDTPG